MTRVDFYHLQVSPLEAALPKLLEKALGAGMKVVVKASSGGRVEALNSLLWQGESHSWLPHGSTKDGFPEDQPIWLTTEEECPNEARLLVLTDGADSAAKAEFDRCLDIFDGTNEDSLAAARSRWKACVAAGHELHYWRQTNQGSWQEQILE